MVLAQQASRDEVAAPSALDLCGRQQRSVSLSRQNLQRSGTPRRKAKIAYHVDQDALCELPKPLHAVCHNQSVARQRMSELQKIFTNSNSEECDAIRERLASLDKEAKVLRLKLASLENELQQSSTVGSIQGTLPDITASVAGPVPSNGKWTSDGRWISTGDSEECESASLWDGDSTEDVTTLPTADTSETQDEKAAKSLMRVQIQDTTTQCTETIEYNDPSNGGMTVSPQEKRFSRRLAESRFHEASLVHERIINEKKAEMKEVERRMYKQEQCITDIKEQILQAELANSQYKIRAQSAECRIRDLSEGIRNAYASSKALLDKRLSMEDVDLRNDALLTYLDDVRKIDAANDAANGASFLDNRKEVRALLERFRCKTKSEAALNVAMEALQRKQQILHDVLRHAEELQTVIDNFHTAWLRLPAAVKENVSYHAFCISTMPPVVALETMVSSCQALIAGQKQYSAMLAEVAVIPGNMLNFENLKFR